MLESLTASSQVWLLPGSSSGGHNCKLEREGSVLLHLCVCLCTWLCVYMCISMCGYVCLYNEWIYLGRQAFWQISKSLFNNVLIGTHLVAFLKAWKQFCVLILKTVSWSFYYFPITFLILHISHYFAVLYQRQSLNLVTVIFWLKTEMRRWGMASELGQKESTASPFPCWKQHTLHVLGSLGGQLTTLSFPKLPYWAFWERSRGRTETPLGNPSSLPIHVIQERLLDGSKPPTLKLLQSWLLGESLSKTACQYQEEQKWLFLWSSNTTYNAVCACDQPARCYCLKSLHVEAIYYTAIENCSICHAKLPNSD